MAANENIQRLESAGLSTEQMPEEQRQVLASLTREEVDTMIRIREKLTEAGGEVQGYRAGDTGIFYF
jgi:hypothetical protein